jgi:hypothetical protein
MDKKLRAWLWALIILAIVIVVGFFDWLTGYQVDFLLFYFLPVSLAGWFLGLDGYLCHCVGWSRPLGRALIFVLLVCRLEHPDPPCFFPYGWVVSV